MHSIAEYNRLQKEFEEKRKILETNFLNTITKLEEKHKEDLETLDQEECRTLSAIMINENTLIWIARYHQLGTTYERYLTDTVEAVRKLKAEHHDIHHLKHGLLYFVTMDCCLYADYKGLVSYIDDGDVHKVDYK